MGNRWATLGEIEGAEKEGSDDPSFCLDHQSSMLVARPEKGGSTGVCIRAEPTVGDRRPDTKESGDGSSTKRRCWDQSEVKLGEGCE